jgi:hypothetical protein
LLSGILLAFQAFGKFLILPEYAYLASGKGAIILVFLRDEDHAESLFMGIDIVAGTGTGYFFAESRFAI